MICKDKSPVRRKGALFVFCVNACIMNNIERRFQEKGGAFLELLALYQSSFPDYFSQ